jgi:hypothetical protein
MSNKKVSVKASISYADADGATANLPQLTFEPEYQAQVHGSYDIPDTTAAGDFVMPFGPIAKATALVIENKTGQAVDVSINGGDVAYTGLADGKGLLIALPMVPVDAITAVTVTTGAVQAGAGSIAYHIWGDPV